MVTGAGGALGVWVWECKVLSSPTFKRERPEHNGPHLHALVFRGLRQEDLKFQVSRGYRKSLSRKLNETHKISGEWGRRAAVGESVSYSEMGRLPSYIVNICKKQIATGVLSGILFLLKYARKIFIGHQ